uniref:TetR/AcrR family transcriptional regulator n=1 Tax=Cellvibrio fontiphilus TaxID=1815559 RepID=UPI002B4BE6F1|nr:TetR/AcrR family transcriptional regulator [Cellvibrio fontiphilus]
MSKRELKKDHLLDAGLKVMATRGYNGTSIQDIVNAADVPKGSFYTYFKSKEDFAIEALEKVTEERMIHNRHLLNDRNLSPQERITRFFIDNIGGCDENINGGCFIGNMCQEMSESSEAIRLKVRQMLRNNTQAIEDVLEEARLHEGLETQLPSAIIAEFLFNAWEGTVMRMKASKCREPLNAFLAVLPEIFTKTQARQE